MATIPSGQQIFRTCEERITSSGLNRHLTTISFTETTTTVTITAIFTKHTDEKTIPNVEGLQAGTN